MKNKTNSHSYSSMNTAGYLITALFISFLFGQVMSLYIQHMGRNQAGLCMLLVVGLGWVLQLCLVKLREPAMFMHYFHSLSRLMFIGVVALVPVIIAHQFISFIPCPWHALSVGLSFSIMYVLHSNLLRSLKMTTWYQLSWAALLLANAILWIAYFNIQYHII